MNRPLCPKCNERPQAPGRYYCLDCLFDTLNELLRIGPRPAKMPARTQVMMERRRVAQGERFTDGEGEE